MIEQRKPTDKERDHLQWFSEQIAAIQKELDHIPHAVAKRIIALTDGLQAVEFDPFGEIFSRCEICEQIILDTDEFEDADGCWVHSSCADNVRAQQIGNLGDENGD